MGQDRECAMVQREQFVVFVKVGVLSSVNVVNRNDAM